MFERKHKSTGMGKHQGAKANHHDDNNKNDTKQKI